MPVNFPAIDAAAIYPVNGVKLATAEANIRKPNRRDLLVIALDAGTEVAGVFTQNRFCAAPVQVCRAHLAKSTRTRALVINTGNANAGTGAPGLAHAMAMASSLAAQLDVAPHEVLPFSTGVILEPLPIQKIQAALPHCVDHLGEASWMEAAQAIMTTDIVAKAASRKIRLAGQEVTVTGIAKGSGMIHPNMATMLGFVATDAKVAPNVLDTLLRAAVNQSFNCVTVDGDTSTNDSCILMATGKVDMPVIADPASADYAVLAEAVTEVMVTLAQMIARDGEGATKFITVAVEGGKDREECRKVAYAIAHSPLVKTAFFASDPNLGRILAALGYAGVDDLDVDTVRVWLDDVLVAVNGGRNPAYREEDGVRVMANAEITVRIDLGRGSARATVWTCDFSHDYVTINADYRS